MLFLAFCLTYVIRFKICKNGCFLETNNKENRVSSEDVCVLLYNAYPFSYFQAMSKCSQPIPCSTFNNDGSIFAYSVSPSLKCWSPLWAGKDLFVILILNLLQVCYDWSKGAENHNPSTAKTCIFLHLPQVYINIHDFIYPWSSILFYSLSFYQGFNNNKFPLMNANW